MDVIKQKFLRLFSSPAAKSAPAAIPYLGDAYSLYVSGKDQAALFSELLIELKKLSEAQYAELREELSKNFIEHGRLLDELRERSVSKVLQEKITAIIPCGGQGGKLFPMTQVMPKALVLIDGKPLLQHIIDSLLEKKEIFEKVIITTGNYHSAIEHCVRQGGYDDFVECYRPIKQPVPPSLIEIRNRISTSRFLLHYNDILLPGINWSEINDNYLTKQKHANQIGSLLCSSYYPLGIGIITEGENPGTLGDFIEKPKKLLGNNLVNTAVSIFETRAIDEYCKENDKSFFKETIKRIHEARECICLEKIGKWHHIQDWNALYDLSHGEEPYRTPVKPSR